LFTNQNYGFIKWPLPGTLKHNDYFMYYQPGSLQIIPVKIQITS